MHDTYDNKRAAAIRRLTAAIRDIIVNYEYIDSDVLQCELNNPPLGDFKIAVGRVVDNKEALIVDNTIYPLINNILLRNQLKQT